MKTNGKDTKLGVVPALRFPEFDNYWDIKELSKIANLIKERARNGNYTPMSVTSGVGLVSQKEKFGRDISGNQYSSYFVIRKGDFAYNKSATNLYPEGYISMLKKLEIAAVPNSIFTCFKVNRKEVLPEYLDYLFENNYHGKWLRKFIEVGARAHGSLSIDTKKLFELPIVFPSINEQQKIADCLSSIDALIKATENKIDELKAHKKGLMQQLFPAEEKTVPILRFPEFQNAGEWKQTTIGAICTISNGKSNVQDNVQNGKYPLFDRSEIIKASNKFLFDCEAIIIPGEGRFIPKYYIGKFDLHQRAYALKDFTCHALFVYHYITAFSFILTQKAVKSTVLSLRMPILEAFPLLLPNIQEQQKIANCLSSVDDLITAQTNRLEALRNHKKGLMQQLFPNIDEC
jgi:type I restriction enzyme S subunit